jgi:iron complex outermembrane receptor protein
LSTKIRNVRASFRPSRTGTLAASVLTVLTSAADAQAVTEWDLPEQPLAQSLRAIAAQSESNIIFERKLVNDRVAPPLKTQASAEDALSKVLEGTGLTYRHLDEKTVTIQLASADAASTSTALYGLRDGRIRLAQAGEPRPTRTVEGRTLIDIEEIIVTGTNIRGIENNTAPIIVLSKEYIDATGYSTASKLLESVTQNFALANLSGQFTPGVTPTQEQGSSVNLRGVGEGTTLVLLNGRRLAPGYRSAAVDISSLPLSAIERVEILPDGASALYGSDAVGGVVNFILRDDFEGAETRVRAGVADGTDEYRISQAVGNAWNSGSGLVSVEYFKRDLLSTADRDFVPSNVDVTALLPKTETYSAMLTGQQEITGSINLFADVLYSKRETEGAGRLTLNETYEIDNTQVAATFGLNWKVGGDWQIQLSGSYAENDSEQLTTGTPFLGLPPTTSFANYTSDTQSAEFKADGTLFTLPGGNVRVAVGTAYRSESYEELARDRNSGMISSSQDVDQDITSAFAEVYIPVVGEGNSITGVKRLELSLAGRYDDYSTAGSSFDPQAGLMWEPIKGVRLRARYGTSYKAPNLLDYNLAFNGAIALAGVPLGPTPLDIMLVNGTAVDTLRPQESESASFGLEFTPESVTGLSVSLNYYKIRYKNFIATPADALTILTDPATYDSLIISNPSVAQVNQFIAIGQLGQGFFALNPDGTPNLAFDPADVDVIVDGRRRNLSRLSTSGVDLSTEYSFPAGRGRIFLGIGGAYVLNRDQQVTASAAEIDTADTIYNPPSWRARGFVSWQLQGWSANLFVSHVDSYVDNRVTTPPGQSKIDSLTTLDARVSYDFSRKFNSGFLSSFSVALSAQNLFDEDPPRVNVPVLQDGGIPFDLGFDPINADPLGRMVTLEFVKTW